MPGITLDPSVGDALPGASAASQVPATPAALVVQSLAVGPGLGGIDAAGRVSGSNLSGTNSGDISLAAVGAVPNADGASLAGQALTLQPADATHPGAMTALAQTFAGDKTFQDYGIFSSGLKARSGGVYTTAVDRETSGILAVGGATATEVDLGSAAVLVKALQNFQAVGTVTGSNLSGTNTGDVTLGTANGLSLAGQALSLAAAIAGGANGALLGTDKTKLDNLSGTNTDDLTLAAAGAAPSANAASLAGQVLTLQPADGTHPGHVTVVSQTFAGAKTFSGGLLSDSLLSATATSLTLKSSMVDGASALAAIIDTAAAWSAAGAKLLSVKTGGTEVAYIDHIGSYYALGTNAVVECTNVHTTDSVAVDVGYFGTTSGPWVGYGRVANGATAVQHILDSLNTMSTVGAKLLSVRNNTAEKAYVDLNGRASVAAVAHSNIVTNAPTNGGSYTPDASVTGFWKLTAGTGVASFTINNPTNPIAGQRATFIIVNSSGGALTVNFGFAFINDDGLGQLSVPDTKRKTVEFIYDAAGSVWVLVSGPSGNLYPH